MNGRRAFRRLLLPVFVFVLFCFASEAYSAEIDVHGTVASFVWKEFIDRQRLLKESGVLTGVGVSYRDEYPGRLILDGSADIFGGRVGYAGGTQTGIPTTSTVDYFGLKLKGDVGRSFPMARTISLEPFGGLGFRTWLRRIHNGITPAGQPVQGYTEQWMTLFARMGTRSSFDISQSTRAFAEAGVKLPLYNENTAYLSTTGIGQDVTMRPGWDWSLFAEAGLGTDRVKAGVFYEGLRFARSPDVAITERCTLPSGQQGQCTTFFFQPKSTADIYGVKLGVLF